MWRLVPALVREMGAGLSRAACAREALIDRNAAARGDALPQDARARACAFSTKRPWRSKQGDMLRRRDRVHALRHLRLSARSDAGRAARARHRRRYRRLHRRDGAQQAEGARGLGGLRRGRDRDDLVSVCARSSAPPNSSATRPRSAEGVVAGARAATARKSPTLRPGESGAHRSQPDAVLRRVAAVRSAIPAF